MSVFLKYSAYVEVKKINVDHTHREWSEVKAIFARVLTNYRKMGMVFEFDFRIKR